jgi:hypothetical protein
MRQLYLPARAGAAIVGGQDSGAPVLRTMSVTVIDRKQLTEELTLTYGGSMESVSFLDRLNYASPFAKATYDAGALGEVEVAYSSGIPPAELYHSMRSSEAHFQDDLTALVAFPRVSLRGGRVRVQRADSWEVGYRKVSGRTSYSLGAYKENIRNAALTVAGSGGMLAAPDLLPDLFSNSSVFNIGNYRSAGYTASVTQALSDQLQVTAAYGNNNVLLANSRDLESDGPDGLRSSMRSSRRHWVMAKASGTAPAVGTKFTGSYQWTDYSALTPAHVYLTQASSPQTGLNIGVRQPLPAFGGFPGRLEATADLRNLLAQGYLAFNSGNGNRLLLVHSPRSVRGGLAFIF